MGRLEHGLSFLIREAIPDRLGRGLLIHQPGDPAAFKPLFPAVVRGAWNAELGEGLADAQRAFANQLQDFGFVVGGHALVPVSFPGEDQSKLFLSTMLSSDNSATSCLRRSFSRLSSWTSPRVASRISSPFRRLLPASMKSLSHL